MPGTILGDAEEKFTSCLTDFAVMRDVMDKFSNGGDPENAHRVECEYSLVIQESERLHYDHNRIRDWGNEATAYREFRLLDDCRAHIEGRARETQNPVLGTIYNLAIWELCRDIAAAQRTIAHTINASLNFCEKQKWIEMTVAAWRGFTLAARIGSQELLERSKQSHFSLMNSLGNDGNYRWHIELLQSLLAVPRALTEKDLALMCECVRVAIDFYEGQTPKRRIILTDLDVIESQIHAARNRPDEALKCRARSAERSFEEGRKKLEAGQGLAAIGILQEAY